MPQIPLRAKSSTVLANNAHIGERRINSLAFKDRNI